MRALRRHLVDDRGVEKRAIACTGYWRRQLSQDAAPTPEDAADQAEQPADVAF
ncbi:SIP domain-containing protein [Pseudonocardia nigra]|uniref:SIP domain-containing protein n=1 Tax=Pseudonocardia nigra TaxID=1921578 RepID=UPI001C5F16A3|nr:SIP domain-containing protein [Pseudonocardia nigra]